MLFHVTVTPTDVAPLVDIAGPDRLAVVDGQSVELTCSARGQWLALST